MWLIVENLPLKAGWRDAPLTLWVFSRSNKFVQNFSLNWQSWFYRPDLTKKGISDQKRKSEHHHCILHIRISLGTKFHLNMATFIFWTKFSPTEYFWSEQKKWTAPLNSGYSNYSGYQISASTDDFNFLDQIELSFLDHIILHIRIDLGAKFQLQLTILIFWTKSTISGP